MIPPQFFDTNALPTVRPTRSVLLRRLRATRRTATRLLRRRHLMHQPVTSWPHNSVPDTDEHDCLCWLPDDETLLLYDPASETSETWLSCDNPIDLRDHA